MRGTVDAMCAELGTALGFEWEAWTSPIGVRFTVSIPNGTQISVSYLSVNLQAGMQVHGGAWELVIGWPTIGEADGVSTVYDTWDEVVAEVADLGASLR